jgi:hypothetical protein
MVKRHGSKSPRKGQSEGSAPRPNAPQVTSEDALKFIQDMQREVLKSSKPGVQNVRLQKYLAQFEDAQLKAIGRRVQSDLMFGRPRTVKSEDLEIDPPRQSSSRKKSHS